VSGNKVERRKTVRKAVFDSFQVFLVIPKAGLRRIHLKDLSSAGVGFYAEPTDRFKEGAEIKCYFYLNPSLKLPLVLKAVHVTTEEDGRTRVGCEFAETNTKSFGAYVAFLDLMDQLTAFVDESGSDVA
jgi:hypothetical protein